MSFLTIYFDKSFQFRYNQNPRSFLKLFMKKPRIFKDRVIAYKRGNNYLAVSLDFDLLAEGNSAK